jgi:hypothetical protein
LPYEPSLKRALAVQRGQRNNGGGAARVLQRLRDRVERVILILRGLLQALTHLLRELRGLIHDYPAIDDVRETTGNGVRPAREGTTQGKDPQRDNRGLAQAGSELDVGREATRLELRKEPVLPVARAVVTGERTVERVEVVERENGRPLSLIRRLIRRIRCVRHWHPSVEAQPTSAEGPNDGDL